MEAVQNTRRHACGHCQEEVLTVEHCRIFDKGDMIKWRLPLKHSPHNVEKAASSGCPFFLWLWDQLTVSGTPPEQMRRTTIVLELEAMKLKGQPTVGKINHHLRQSSRTPDRGNYEITGCTLWVETKNYAWTPAKFDVISDWNDSSANNSIARTIDGHTSSRQAITQVQRRLQYCLTHHDGCKASLSNTRPIRFLLVGGASADSHYIKVVRAQRLQNGDTEPYATLSYCWGQDQVFKATLANKVDIEARGVPVSLLPKSIKDAIHLTRELNIKLLWIDSLCLVQDDKEELAKEIAKMHFYYSNSCVTISAAAASSSSQGFLHNKPMLYTSEDDTLGPFYFPVDLEAVRKPYLPRISSWMTRNFWPKTPAWLRTTSWLKLVIRSNPEEAIDSRAWTLQEGLLSRRLVSFGSRVVRWSCQTGSYGAEQNEHLWHSWRAFHSEIGDHHNQSNASYLKLWCTLVESYTARALSHEQDRLVAISGIASTLCQRKIAREALVDEEISDAAGPAPNSDEHVGGQVSAIFPRQGPADLPTPRETLRSGLSLELPLSAESSRSIDPEQYAAGLLDKPMLMMDGRKAIDDEGLVSIVERVWNPSGPGHQSDFKSSLLILQLIWTPRPMTSGPQRQDAHPSSCFVAPSWSWASHRGAVDTHITQFDDLSLGNMQYDILKSGFRILDVKTVPRSPEAPYGSLSCGSLTVESTVGSLNMHVRPVFDIQGPNAPDRGRSDLVCLQIIPNICLVKIEDLRKLYEIPHGLVLEPVDLRGQSQSSKNYRRVGVYYSPYISEQGPVFLKTLSGSDLRSLTIGLVGGERERITII